MSQEARPAAASSHHIMNPHALSIAQDDAEVLKVMHPPPLNFNVYRDKPLSTGVLKERKLVHSHQDWHCSVHVWLVDPCRKQILLQKRSPHKDTFPNRWDISAAGHVAAAVAADDGDDDNTEDSVKHTAVREVEEELGIATCPEELEYAFTCPAEQAPWGGCNAYEHVFFQRADLEHCTFAIGSAEVTSVRWMAIDELQLAWRNGDESFVPRVEKYKKAFFAHLNHMDNISKDVIQPGGGDTI